MQRTTPQMNSEVTARLKEVMQDFKAKVPVIVELGNPAMRARHWQKLFKVSVRQLFMSSVFECTPSVVH